MASAPSRGRILLAGAVALTAIAGAYAFYRVLRQPSREGRRPPLARAIDGGTMEGFLGSSEEKDAILDWVADGAPERAWPAVRALFEKRCDTCHASSPDRFEMLALDRYEAAARASRVRPVLEEKITGGTMGEYLESAEEQAALVSWSERGAPENEWPRIRPILAQHCVPCHNASGVAGIPSLETYRATARLTR